MRKIITDRKIFDKLQELGIKVERTIANQNTHSVFFTSTFFKDTSTGKYRKYIYIGKGSA